MAFSLDHIDPNVPANAPAPRDYIDQIPPEELLRDGQVLDDLRTYYIKFQKELPEDATDEEVIGHFYDDRVYKNVNLGFGLAPDATIDNLRGDDYLRAKARVEKIHKQMPLPWQEGGIGDHLPTSQILGDYAYAIATDPTNYVGPAILVKLGWHGLKLSAQAIRAAIGAGRSAGSAVGREIGKKAMFGEAAIGAGLSATASALTQKRDIELGLRDEFSAGELAWDTGIGGATAGALGYGIGYASGRLGGKRLVGRDQELMLREIQQQVSRVAPDTPFARLGDVLTDDLRANYDKLAELQKTDPHVIVARRKLEAATAARQRAVTDGAAAETVSDLRDVEAVSRTLLDMEPELRNAVARSRDPADADELYGLYYEALRSGDIEVMEDLADQLDTRIARLLDREPEARATGEAVEEAPDAAQAAAAQALQEGGPQPRPVGEVFGEAPASPAPLVSLVDDTIARRLQTLGRSMGAARLTDTQVAEVMAPLHAQAQALREASDPIQKRQLLGQLYRDIRNVAARNLPPELASRASRATAMERDALMTLGEVVKETPPAPRAEAPEGEAPRVEEGESGEAPRVEEGEAPAVTEEEQAAADAAFEAFITRAMDDTPLTEQSATELEQALDAIDPARLNDEQRQRLEPALAKAMTRIRELESPPPPEAPSPPEAPEGFVDDTPDDMIAKGARTVRGLIQKHQITRKEFEETGSFTGRGGKLIRADVEMVLQRRANKRGEEALRKSIADPDRIALDDVNAYVSKESHAEAQSMQITREELKSVGGPSGPNGKISDDDLLNIALQREGIAEEGTGAADDAVRRAVDEAEAEAAFDALPFRQRSRARIEKLLEAEGIPPDELAGFLQMEAGSDGRIGVAEARNAIAAYRQAKSALDDLTPAQQIKRVVEERDALIRAIEQDYARSIEGDDALLSVESFERMQDEIRAVQETAEQAINKIKSKAPGAWEMSGTLVRRMLANLTPEEERIFQGLVYFHKRQGVSAEAAQLKAMKSIAEHRAKVEEARARAAEDKAAGVVRTESATGRAGHLLETGPTKAGIGSRGIQGFLRNGTRIAKDSEYTVQGKITSGAYRGLTGFDADGVAQGVEVAQALRELDKTTTPVVFRAVEPTPAVGESEPLRKGELGFWDPITRRVYADEDTMLKARGDRKVVTPNTTKVANPKDAVRDMLDTIASTEGLSVEERLAAMRKALERHVAPAKAPEQARADRAVRAIDDKVEPPPEGYRWGLLSRAANKDGKHELRVLNNKQVEAGSGVDALLGKADPQDWVLLHVPDGVRSTRSIAPADIDALGVVEPGGKVAAPKKASRAMTRDELSLVEVDEGLLDRELLDEVRALTGGRVTGDDLWAFGLRLETAAWLDTEAEWAAHVAKLERVYAALDEIAPAGIRRPTQTIAEAVDDLEDILSSLTSADDVAAARRIIEGMAGDRAPTFELGERPQFDPNTNRVRLGRENPVYYPRAMTVMHEVLHWAYVNLLTNSDRLQFWRSLGKFYKDGRLDMGAVEKASPKAGRAYSAFLTATHGRTKTWLTNELLSPQELFANQGMMYGTARRQFGLENENLWRRVQAYMKALFERFVKGTVIDDDLVPLFAKIMPDDADAARAAAHEGYKPQTKLGQHVQKRYVALREQYDALLAALEADDITASLHHAGQLVTEMYSIVPSQRHLRKMGREKSTGAFGPFLPIRDAMRTKANQLAHILSGGRDEVQVMSKKSEYSDEWGLDDHEWSADPGEPREKPEGSDYDAERWLEQEGQRMEKAMSALRAWIDDESRKLGKISSYNKETKKYEKELQYGSMKQLWDLITDASHRAFVRAEGKAALNQDVPGAGTVLTEHSPDKRTYNPTTERFRARARGKRKALEDRVQAAADRVLGKRSGERLPDAERALPELRGRSVRQLARLYDEFAGTRQGEEIARELLRQRNTGTVIEAPKGLTKLFKDDLRKARMPDLERMLKESLENNKVDETTGIIYEMQRRAWNRQPAEKRKNITIAPLKMEGREVSAAIARELADSVGGVEDGIPKAARFHLQDALLQITHRDPAVQEMVRTMAYRMFNLMGRTARDATEHANLLSADDVYRLARTDRPATRVGGVVADLRGPEFAKLRNDLRRLTVGLNKGRTDPFDLMHEVGHLVMRTMAITDRDRANILGLYLDATDVLKRQVEHRQYGELTGAELIERRAEEWFVESWSQYLGERVAKGDVFGGRYYSNPEQLQLRGWASTMLDRLTEMVAYVANGLIGRRDVRQIFRRLTLYGDPIGNGSRGARTLRNPIQPPELAAMRWHQIWQSLSAQQQERLLAFVDEGIGLDGDEPLALYHGSPVSDLFDAEDFIFMPSADGDYGPGIYLTTDRHVADWTYAKRSTGNAMIRAIELSDLPAQQKERAKELARDLSDTWRAIAQRKRSMFYLQDDLAKGVDGMMDAEMEEMMRFDLETGIREAESAIDSMEFLAEELQAELRKTGYTPKPGVIGAYARALKPFDAKPSARYTTQDAVVKELVTWMYRTMQDEAGNLTDVTRAFNEHIKPPLARGSVDGMTLYASLADALAELVGGRSTARAMLNEQLGRMGYDSIDTMHSNVVADRVAKHRTIVLIDAPNNPASNRAKAMNAPYKDHRKPYFNHSDDTFRANSAMLGGMLQGERPDRLAAPIMEMAMGPDVDDATRTLVTDITRNRMPKPTTLDRLGSVWTRAFSANYERMRKSGMNWLADYTENYFPEAYERFGQRFMPIVQALRKLPDSDSSFRRWVRKSNPRDNAKSQPASHERILQALRRGPASRHFRNLSAQERVVYDMARTSMNELHAQMRDEGLLVGWIENYMPQLWDTDAIRADVDGYTERLTQYLLTESSGRTLAEARATADGIVSNILAEDGVYLPPRTSIGQGVNDSLDFQRMIRLDRYPGHMDALEPFMVNNLETLLAKYIDGASKRLTQTRGMGVNMHALNDYMEVGQDGVDGILRLLSSPKVISKRVKGVNEEGVVEEGTLEMIAEMPFVTRGQGAEVVREIVERFARNRDTNEAYQSLLSLLPPEKVTPSYERRVRAIAEAMRDFEMNEAGRVVGKPRDELIHAQSTMRLLQGRQYSRDVSQMGLNTSRAFRAFNNVSLLGFTLLTSLPDAVLPLIRSGSFSDFARGLTKYATDKVYREGIRRTGVAVENELHQRMAGLFAADSRGRLGRWQNAFFNATLLTPWTDMWRGLAGAVALESFRTMQRRILQEAVAGVPEAQQSAAVKTAYRYMNRYGLRRFLDDPNASIDTADPVVGKAMIRFANDTIFAPTPDEVPVVWQTPFGALAWQLKSFPLMMGRMAGDVMSEARKGNAKPLVYLLTLSPLAGAASMAIKDIVQGRGGEEGHTHALRERMLSDYWEGAGDVMDTDVNQFLGWYLESMIHAGGLGLLADIIHDVAINADNGAFGAQRLAGTFLGPTYGLTFSSGFNVVGGARQAAGEYVFGTLPETNSKQRQAVRELAMRLPVVGQIKSAREKMVDLVAPERTRGKAQGWGNLGLDLGLDDVQKSLGLDLDLDLDLDLGL